MPSTPKHVFYLLVEEVARSAERNRRHTYAEWKHLVAEAAIAKGIEWPDVPGSTLDDIASWADAAYRRVLAAEILSGRDIDVDPPGGWKPVITEYAREHGIDLDNYGSLNTMVSAITSIRNRRNSITTPKRGADVMSGPTKIPGAQRRRIIDPKGL